MGAERRPFATLAAACAAIVLSFGVLHHFEPFRAVFFLVSVAFVWRSFYAMRIPVEQ